MKLSVVIPSYEDAVGLWYTFAACTVDLEADFAKDEYEIIGVVDGPEDDASVLLNLRQQHTLPLVFTQTRTPQKNRHVGLHRAQARYVFFLDSHVVPSRGFFKRMLQSMEETGAAILHAPHCFWRQNVMAFGYHLDWKEQFWASTSEGKPLHADRPYRICMAGHGAICVDREQYNAIDGYWDLLEGWGGEEPELNLRAWLMGHEVYMEPRVYHWHFMPNKRRLENIQLTLPYVRNFLLVAYATGGEKYLAAVMHFFTQANNGMETLEAAIANKPVNPYGELYDEIPRIAAKERARILTGPHGGDLDRLREFFKREGIPH